MQKIKASSDSIEEILKEYDTLIGGVFEKIRSVQGVANKTNLLAINASIETIHASDLLASFEQIVSDNLLIQARMIATILKYDPDFLHQEEKEFARDCGMEGIDITDETGTVIFSATGSKNGSLKSVEVMKILKNQDLEVVLPATGDSFSGDHHKIVAIGRKDQPGIIQLGAHFTKPKGQLAINGFGVVAQEAKRLADVSKEISLRITGLTGQVGAKVQIINEESGDMISRVREEALADLAELKEKVLLLEKSLMEIRIQYKELSSPLSELISIARQTNLLGVRAAIEAAHSTNDKQDFDNLMNDHMTTEAKLAARYIEIRDYVQCEDVTDFCHIAGIGEMWVTDEYGTVEFTNVSGGKGFVFKDEGQTAPYMALLTNRDLVVTAPPSSRVLDNKIFKYVGVSRRGRNGILQIGSPSKLYGESTAEGFSVVAKQIKSLSEQSRETTKEIEEMIHVMDTKATKALNQIKTFLRQIDEAGNRG